MMNNEKKRHSLFVEDFLALVKNHMNYNTSSVSPELLHGFARGLAPIAFWRNITLLSINMKVIWRASLLKNCEQANQCNNSGETEEVLHFLNSNINT